MDDEKRMVDTYEVKHAIHVGDKEILFAVDDTKPDYPYMVCNCTWDNPLGIDHYSGKESRWNREDILGTLKPEHMPDWAKERLKQIQAEQQAKHKKREPER